MKRRRAAGARDRARASIASAAGQERRIHAADRIHELQLAGNARKQKKECERHQEVGAAVAVLPSTGREQTQRRAQKVLPVCGPTRAMVVVVVVEVVR